jgi:phage gp16-like protein
MTNAQKNYKKQLIQKIQINKSNVFFDDEERKEFIRSRFGVDSTTKLSIDQLKLLLDFLLQKSK